MPPTATTIKDDRGTMAKQAIYGSQLTHELMNGGQSYRIKFSCGTFSIAAKATKSGTYYSAYKRFRGKLYKVYVGKAGDIERHDVQRACVGLLSKICEATGESYARDNRSRVYRR